MTDHQIVKTKDFRIKSSTKSEHYPHTMTNNYSNSEQSNQEFMFNEPFQIVQQNLVKTAIGKHAKSLSFNKMTMLDEKEIMCLKYDRDGAMIAAGLANGYVFLYNPYTGNIIRRFEASVEGEIISSLRFSPQ